jgi:predicted peptidase
MALRLLGVLVLSLAVLAGPAAAQGRQETGFLDRSLTLDGIEYSYEVYVPRDFDPHRKWPVILALHGGGEYGSDGMTQTAGGLANAIRRHPERYPAIVVFPHAHADGTPGWQHKSGQAALEEVDRALAEFHGDASRVYLTGYSAGGNGAWFLAYHHPTRFAALVVICGFVSDFTGLQSHVFYPGIVAAAASPDRYTAVARELKDVPVWIFHGDADKNVSVEESRRMAAALKAVGGTVRYTELPGVDHRAWDPAYADPDMATWLFEQRRR